MAGGGGAIRAGRAFVELFVDDNPLVRGLDKAAGLLKGWGAQVSAIGAGLAGGGAALFAPLAEGFKEFVGRAADLQLFSDRIGESVAAMSRLQGGFERAGVSAEAFQAATEGLKLKVKEAADANGYLLDSFKSLGRGSQLAGKDVRELLYTVADGMQRIPDEVGKLQAADRLGLRGILPQLKKGRAGVDELFAAGGPGAVTEEEGRQALEVSLAMRDAWRDLKDTALQLGAALLPTAGQIAEMKDQFKATLGQVRDWIKENKGAVVAVAAVGAGLIAAGAVLGGFGAAVVGVGLAIKATLAALGGFAALLGSPFLLGAAAGLAAVAGGFYLIVEHTETGKAALASFLDDLGAVAGRAKAAFGGVADAIQAGDWQLAFEVGVASLKAEWAEFQLYLQLGWNVTKELLVDTWHQAVTALKKLFVDLGAFVGRTIEGNLRAVIDKAAGLVELVDGDLAGKLRAAGSGLMSNDEIDAGAEAVKAQIDAEEEARQEQANSERAAAGLEALQNRDAARAEADRLQALAAWRKEFAAMPDLGELFDDEGGGAQARLPDLRTYLSDAVKSVTNGTSGAAISQQLAFGDTIPQQQLDVQRNIASNTAQIPQLARDMNVLARQNVLR